jgi:hypothetical protein
MKPNPLLSRPLTPKDHDPLVSIDDAYRYILALPKEVAELEAWREAAKLAVAALDQSAVDPAVIESVTKRIELALFITHRLALGWRRASYHFRARRAAVHLLRLDHLHVSNAITEAIGAPGRAGAAAT